MGPQMTSHYIWYPQTECMHACMHADRLMHCCLLMLDLCLLEMHTIVLAGAGGNASPGKSRGSGTHESAGMLMMLACL